MQILVKVVQDLDTVYIKDEAYMTRGVAREDILARRVAIVTMRRGGQEYRPVTAQRMVALCCIGHLV